MNVGELVAVELEHVEWSTWATTTATGEPRVVEYAERVGLLGVERIAFLVEPRLVAITRAGEPARIVPCERVGVMVERSVTS